MDDSEILGVLKSRKAAAESYENEEVVSKRILAHDYYEGKPFGNEIVGRSSVISTDVRDAIEWIKPTLLRIFASGEDVVEFEPQNEEELDFARVCIEHGFALVRELLEPLI